MFAGVVGWVRRQRFIIVSFMIVMIASLKNKQTVNTFYFEDSLAYVTILYNIYDYIYF